MENEKSGELVASEAGRQRLALCEESDRFGRLHADSRREEVKRIVQGLVERFELTKEDLVSAYDECIAERDDAEVRVEKNESDDALVLQEQQQHRHDASNCRGPGLQVNGESLLSDEGIMNVQEEGDNIHVAGTVDETGEDEAAEDEREDMQIEREKDNELQLESVIDSNQVEEKEEVDKMQTLVQSALRVYEATSMTSELGQKRRCFTLEDELTLQPSSFAQELLDRDQSVVAQAIKKYMNQYSVPQREVVEKTGLNQSHLSQHFLHGVTMKRSKRVKLYHWFEDDQRIRTGKPSTADGALNSVLESPKVEGSRRRPRWKWSPISTQILSEAFKKNHFPTREQRVELAKVCNEAELTMNNGSPVRGPEGDTEGITEQRVNTWFTNRRKGLSTPSPTRGLNSLFTHGVPPLLRAATPTTPTQSHSHMSELDSQSRPSPVPAAVQTLVSNIQQVQAATSSGSAIQLAGTPTASAQALPLTTITLPGGASGTVLAAGTSLSATTPAGLQTFTINSEGIPTALIPPSQLQIQLATSSGNFVTIPMLHPQKANTLTPSHLHMYTVTSSPALVKSAATRDIPPLSSASPISSSSISPTFTTLPTLKQSQAPAIIGQLQLQSQRTPHLQFNPTSSLSPVTITLPGVNNEDIIRAQALLVNHQAAGE